MKVYFVSLGCDKNLVDSEMMLGYLRDAGHEFTSDENEAEIAIVNTCTFIHDAKEESIQTVIDLGALKENGNLKGLIMTGCLAERYAEDIRTELPEVDAVIGTNSYDSICDAIDSINNGQFFDCRKPLNGLPTDETIRSLSTPNHYAYLKIAEGCAKHCTYCIIPKVRGNFRSVPMERLLAQAKHLAKEGVKELVLVAQETTLYGIDLFGKKSLALLLRKLSEIDGIEWIRILYCYPEEIDDELIVEMKDNPKVCHYLDLPIQHASDRILKRMGRRTSNADLRAIISKLREEIPDICLRTTMITGFPGETEEDVETLLDFMDEMEFDRLGAFTYSPEEGTPAAAFEDQIDEEIKSERKDQIMALQQEITEGINECFIGETLRVLVEGMLPDSNTYIARSYRDTPDVDGYVFFESDYELMSGAFVDVRIIGTNEYDLIGELIDDDESAE